ncbi:unnamed protein product [Cuscuta epithymum]|uniref:CCHC-type domain-containing protein n=1 Tax=Cuscuta epithymum TaxID=186058 RepID=A0AAV0DVT2_9ASTE|nr:unnamed protein product [Cuscuta epithymum]
MNGELLWPRTQNNDIAPPIPKKLTGRPKKKRTREANEVRPSVKARSTVSRKGRIMTCSVCKKEGHNKAKCPNKPHDSQTSSTRPSSSHQPPKAKKNEAYCPWRSK